MSSVADSERTYTRCCKRQPLTAFTKQAANRNGRSAWCKPCTNNYSRDAYARRTASANRNMRLRTRYGITFSDYVKMYTQQRGCCAICGTQSPEIPKDGTLPLHVDHDHASNAVRELLCRGCNSAVGHMEDDPRRLEKAAAYIRKHTANQE